MEDTVKNKSLSLMTIQAKARILSEDLKIKFSNPEARVVVCNGWFRRFISRANFHNVKFCSEAASADSKAAETCSEILGKITEEGVYTAQQICYVNETGLF
jgi:hypothetical protein